MKKYCKWILSGIFLCALFGCASSERMNRISGGVIEEYSAPASYRIRSKKFQAVNQKLSTPERAAKGGIPDFDKPLLNLWPFYFRSDEYISALWPMIDYDPYGMAVRPFYNQEGDEYSVLFPLSAWNPESREGWILNAAWAPGKFLLLPFAGIWSDPAESGGYCLPIAGWNRERLAPGWDEKNKDLRRKSEDVTVILPVYTNHVREIDPGDYAWLYRWRTDAWLREMRYRLTRQNLPVPENEAEITALRKRIAATLPVRERVNYGVLPFFTMEHFLSGKRILTMIPLCSQYRWKGEEVSWDAVFSLLGAYTYKPLPASCNPLSPETGEESLRILNFYCSRERTFDPGKDGAIASDLRQNAEPARRETANRLLKQLDPALKLPDTVVDWNTMDLYLQEVLSNRQYPVKESVSYGFLPLIFGNCCEDSGMWASIGLMSWGMWNRDTSFWAALPLLSMQSKEAYSGWTTIFTPLAYFQKYHKSAVPEESRIAEPDAVFPTDTVSSLDTYGACGLFYRGKVQFYAGNDRGTWRKADQLQRNLMRLAAAQKQLTSRRTGLDRERQRIREWKPAHGDRVDAARRNLRREELRVREIAWRKEHQNLQKDFLNLKNTAKELGLSLTLRELNDQDARRKFLQNLLQKHAVLREKEDIGSGFFFRRENFWNGDYHWRLLWGLAGASKKGAAETAHILHFLYRKRQEDTRSEVIVFPFISSQQDGARSRFSFLGRIWQRTAEADGSTYGYCCFVPFGKHPEVRGE